MRGVCAIQCFLIASVCGAFGQTGSLTLTISNGVSMISNPYNSGGNTVAELFEAVPEGTLLYMLDAPTQRWSVNQFQFGNWTHPAQTLPPGTGALIWNHTNAFSVTFTGLIPSSVTTTIHDGINLVSWFPDSCPPAMEGDWIRSFSGGTFSYEYFCGFGWWPEPTFQPGEAFVYVRGTNAPRPSVYFNNYLPAAGINTYYTSSFGCIGTNMVAQIYYGTNDISSQLQPLGEPLPIREMLPGKGYVDTSSGAVRELPESRNYYFQIRVPNSPSWCGWLGFGILTRGDAYAGNRPTSLWPDELRFPVKITGPITPYPVWHYPSNTVVVKGQDAAFVTTFVQDSCGYTFAWQRELNPGQWLNMPGETNLSLLFPSAQLTDAGTYRLVITHNVNNCTNRILPSVTLRVLTTLPVFNVSRLSANEIELNVTVDPGFDYAIEFSENLVSWTNLTVSSNSPIIISVRDSILPGVERRFYRARLLP